MNTDQEPLSEVSKQLTQTPYSFKLPPLTPEEIEKNQAIYERLMDEVLGDGELEKSRSIWEALNIKMILKFFVLCRCYLLAAIIFKTDIKIWWFAKNIRKKIVLVPFLLPQLWRNIL